VVEHIKVALAELAVVAAVVMLEPLVVIMQELRELLTQGVEVEAHQDNLTHKQTGLAAVLVDQAL
jgi:homoserine kinase